MTASLKPKAAKIKVTQQQRDNALDALLRMWPSVPTKNVYPGLLWWRKGEAPQNNVTCGTVACFGGWCAVYPKFVAQGVARDWCGTPSYRNGTDCGSVNSAALHLFGDDTLFIWRTDYDGPGTDHEVVTRRLQNLIRNSVVAK